MKIPMLIAIIIILCMLITYGNALTVKSEPQKEVVDARILNSIGQSKAETSTPVVKIAEGGNVRETFRYEKSSGDPIQIQKYVFPGNKKKYSKDDILRIFIEVKARNDIGGMKIQEFLSDDQIIINTSNYCYRIGTLKELHGYRDLIFGSLQKDMHNNQEEFINIYRHPGASSLYWENLTNEYISPEEKEKIAYFLNNIISLDSLNKINITKINEINITKVDARTVIINNKIHNISISTFEENNTAILKYNNFVYHLFVEREPLKRTKFDNKTGKILIENFKGNLKLSNLDNMFEMYIPTLKSRERFIYWYCIKPNRESTINTITTARIYDNNFPDYPDVDYPLDIEINRPKCEVTATFDKYKLISPEKLKITYNIYSEDLATYNILPIQVKLDDTSGNFKIFYLDKKNKIMDNNFYDINLTSDKVTNITYLIGFKNSGSFTLPGIWIDGKLYPFEEEITVMNRFESTQGWATLLFTLLIGILSISFGQIFSSDIKTIIEAKKNVDKKYEPKNILIMLSILVVLVFFAYIIYVKGILL
jgi:hypothetical protein